MFRSANSTDVGSAGETERKSIVSSIFQPSQKFRFNRPKIPSAIVKCDGGLNSEIVEADDIGLNVMIAYGATNLGTRILWYSRLTWLFYFYLIMVGLNLAAAVAVILILAILDALNDPIVGFIPPTNSKNFSKR